MFALLRQAVLVFVVLTLVTGVAYPLVMTGVAQVVFPHQANGSLIERDGKVVGSELIGQQFDDPKYFWSRPSATSPAYNGAASTGSNFGPTNPAQLDAVRGRVEAPAQSASRPNRPGAGRSGDGVRQRARSAHQPGGGRISGRSRRAGARHGRRNRARNWLPRHTEGRTFGHSW